jgi:hypothetical protein
LVRAVAANNDKTVDTAFTENFCAALLAFRCHELFTTSRLQHRTSTLYNIAHAAQIHLTQVIVQQSLVPALNAKYFDSMEDSAANHRTHSGVHSLRIASTRKDGNRFNS